MKEKGQRMMCWRQVHLHSLQTQHRPVLGVSIPAALTGRFMASLCACASVHVCVFRGRRDKWRARETTYKRKSLCE